MSADPDKNSGLLFSLFRNFRWYRALSGGHWERWASYWPADNSCVVFWIKCDSCMRGMNRLGDLHVRCLRCENHG